MEGAGRQSGQLVIKDYIFESLTVCEYAGTHSRECLGQGQLRQFLTLTEGVVAQRIEFCRQCKRIQLGTILEYRRANGGDTVVELDFLDVVAAEEQTVGQSGDAGRRREINHVGESRA